MTAAAVRVGANAHSESLGNRSSSGARKAQRGGGRAKERAAPYRPRYLIRFDELDEAEEAVCAEAAAEPASPMPSPASSICT